MQIHLSDGHWQGISLADPTLKTLQGFPFAFINSH